MASFGGLFSRTESSSIRRDTSHSRDSRGGLQSVNVFPESQSLPGRVDSGARVFRSEDGTDTRDHCLVAYEDLSKQILDELHDLKIVQSRIESQVLAISHQNLSTMSNRPSRASSLHGRDLSTEALDIVMPTSATSARASASTFSTPSGHQVHRHSSSPVTTMAPSSFGAARPRVLTSSMLGTSQSGSEVHRDLLRDPMRIGRNESGGGMMRGSRSSLSHSHPAPQWLDSYVDPAKHWPKEITLKPSLQELAATSGILADQSLERLKNFAKATDLRAFAGSQFMPEAQHDQGRGGASGPWPCCVLHPNSNRRIVWDVLTLILVAFDSIAWPAVVAWEVDPDGWWLTCLALGVLVWSLDILAQTHIAYFDADGQLEVRRAWLLKHYMRTTMVPDLILLLCDWFSLASAFSEEAGSEPSRTMHRLTRGLWILKLCRLPRLYGIIARLLDNTPPQWNFEMSTRCLAVLFAIIWLNHLGSCCWFAVGLHAYSDTGRSWLDEPSGTGLEPFSQAPSTFQYLTSLHWSTSQMTFGYTDIHPSNAWERLFNVICLLLGVICFSFLVSALTAQVVDNLNSRQEARTSIAALRQFLSEAGIRTTLRLRVERQAARSWNSKEQPLRMSEVAALPLLTKELRSELRCALGWPYASGHPLWKLLALIDGHTMQRICGEGVDFHVHSAGDTLFATGGSALYMYVIKHGEIDYRWTPAGENSSEHERLGDGRRICEVAMWSEWAHVGSATAAGDVEVITVNAETFASTAVRARLLRDFVVEYGCLFHARLVMATPPQSELPTDVRVPGTEFHELLMMMHLDLRIFVGLVGVELLRQRRQALFHGVSVEHINELEREVCSGRCVLTPNEKGEAERISVVTLLRLTNDHGRLLVQLGKWSTDHHIEAQCRLPGQQQNAGEGPEATLRKLMDSKLHPFVGGIRLGVAEKITELRESKHFGISTRYMQNIRSGQFDESWEIPVTFIIKYGCTISPGVNDEEPYMPAPVSPGSASSMASSWAPWVGALMGNKVKTEGVGAHPEVQATVYAVAVSNVVYFFAWLTEDEMEFLNTTIGDQHLQAALDDLKQEAEVLQRLCSYGWHARNLSPSRVQRQTSFEDLPQELEAQSLDVRAFRRVRPRRTRSETDLTMVRWSEHI